MCRPLCGKFFMSTIVRPKDEDQGDSIDISTVLRFLRRRRAVIISVTILITALVALIVHQLTPQYRAQAVLMIDSRQDRKSTRLNSSHVKISYAVFCLKK